MALVLALLLVPTVAGAAAFFILDNRVRRALLVAAAAVHLLLTGWAWHARPEPATGSWLGIDAPGLIFLSITSVLFLAAAVYAAGYLAREAPGRQRDDIEEGAFFSNAPEATFTGGLLLFLASMTLIHVSQHLGLMWVAVEATTITSASLIYFHRHHRSLEAAWKYLMICSVGIALALLGNFFLAVAASGAHGEADVPMIVSSLVEKAGGLHTPWLKAAFIFFLVGYGTKMGLAPMHTWLPDAHSESPSLVSALLSGALLNGSFLAILRAHQICGAAGHAEYSQRLLLGFGLVSMATAAVFVLGQADYKRLLAYSSVEHMGILALGVGLGGAGRFGAMFHAINHSLTKAMLFLVAGNILALYKTRTPSAVKGLVRVLPVSGVLWVLGFLSITGSPPFGTFLSEFTILKAALDEGSWLVAIVYLLLLAVIFVGMATVIFGMAQGALPKDSPGQRLREPWLAIAPPILLGALVTVLGVHVPDALDATLREAARIIGGSS
ncbi:NADH dehydrogenase FAD-containing subunit [bacterium]|nr:NADH dehydrogenase FAD-containing subunit [bacterium]